MDVEDASDRTLPDTDTESSDDSNESWESESSITSYISSLSILDGKEPDIQYLELLVMKMKDTYKVL